MYSREGKQMIKDMNFGGIVPECEFSLNTLLHWVTIAKLLNLSESLSLLAH